MPKNNKDNLIVSVGAGTTQLPFIKALKEEGYLVAAFGKGRNDLDAIRLCDYFSEIDTSDSEGAINWLRQLELNILGAGSFAGGRAIDTLHEITRVFNLPTEIPKYLSIGMDKFNQQKFYEDYGLNHIKTFNFEEIKNDFEKIRGIENFIIKPSVGRGSAGVCKVNIHELQEILNNNDFDRDDIVQEFIKGEEYRMLIIVQNSDIRLLAPIKRESFKDTFLLGRLSYDSKNMAKIESFANRLVNNLNLKNAIIKTDIIVDDRNVYVIEMDIGVGGGIYYKTYIGHLFNYNVTNEYINLITGKTVSKARRNANELVMDYIYNLSESPITYDECLCKNSLKELLKCEEIIIVPNLLYPGNKGRFETNADFIFCVIHNNSKLSNFELNEFINNKLFIKIEG